MEKFDLHILGCGSAKPTTKHHPASQVVDVRDKLFMIDCGEGTQVQFCKSHLKYSRLSRIFVSHLHGDHCYGLLGLISTLNLLGRVADLHLHGPVGFEKVFADIIQFFNAEMSYKLVFHEFDSSEPEVIYEDRSVTVTTIPLRHRIPCCGFLFREKPTPNHIRRDMIDFYEIPISQINLIKNGADYVMPDGQVIPNGQLTTPSGKPRSYAYCSDTRYFPEVVDQIRQVNLLYHEATFLEEDKVRAAKTFHSTAGQAAAIARDAQVGQLVIGHYSSRYDNDNLLLDEAKQIFTNTIKAYENQRIEIR